MSDQKKNVTIRDIAASFGTTEQEVEAFCGELIRKSDLTYRLLDKDERDAMILSALEAIESQSPERHLPVGKPAKPRWDKGWGENLESYRAGGSKLETLTPKFFRPGTVLRWQGDYMKPNDPGFELNYFSIYKQWLFKKYLAGAPEIHEFGCGPGFNLIPAAQIVPDATVYGLDWSEPAVELVNAIGKDHNLKIKGKRFDFFEPDYTHKLGKDSVVFTVGAVESTGTNWRPFYDYLREYRPKLIVNTEPTIENYDQTILFDWLGARYHKKRQYLEGYIGFLRGNTKEVKIEHSKRLFFGSSFHEGFQLTVWRFND